MNNREKKKRPFWPGACADQPRRASTAGAARGGARRAERNRGTPSSIAPLGFAGTRSNCSRESPRRVLIATDLDLANIEPARASSKRQAWLSSCTTRTSRECPRVLATRAWPSRWIAADFGACPRYASGRPRPRVPRYARRTARYADGPHPRAHRGAVARHALKGRTHRVLSRSRRRTASRSSCRSDRDATRSEADRTTKELRVLIEAAAPVRLNRTPAPRGEEATPRPHDASFPVAPHPHEPRLASLQQLLRMLPTC